MIEHQKIFEQIVRSPRVHARFLNTLAFMELAGAQYLSKLVPYLGSTTYFLEHVAEEYRHAFFLRKLGEKIAGHTISGFTSDTLYCSRLSRGYITNLQRQICLLLKSCGLHEPHIIKQRTYLLSTFAIETRALVFYQAYQAALDHAEIALSVRSIISEEEDHLAIMNTLLAQDPDCGRLLNRCLELEHQLFNAWFNEIIQHISQAAFSSEKPEALRKDLIVSGSG